MWGTQWCCREFHCGPRQGQCCWSIVLILAYKEDEDKLPYAVLVIIFKCKIFHRGPHCLREAWVRVKQISAQ